MIDKIHISLILVISIYHIIFSQQDLNQYPNLISVIKYEYSFKEMHGEFEENLVSISIQHFDSSGNNIINDHYKTDKEFNIVGESIFDSEGKIVRTLNKDLNNTIKYSFMSEYNAETNKIEYSVYDSQGLVIYKKFKKFDSNGNIIDTIDGNTKRSIKLDEYGHIIEELIFSNDHLLYNYLYQNRYDEKNYLVDRIKYRLIPKFGKLQKVPISKSKIEIIDYK